MRDDFTLDGWEDYYLFNYLEDTEDFDREKYENDKEAFEEQENWDRIRGIY